MTQQNRRVSHQLVAMSSAAVLAVYSAGYLRTQDAAERLATETGQERRAFPLADDSPTRQLHTDVAPGSEASGPEWPFAVAEAGVAPQTGPAVEPAPAQAPPTAPIVDGEAPAERVLPHAEAMGVQAVAPEPAGPAVEAAQAGAASTAIQAPSVVAAQVADATPKYKDGTYTGWGTSRHGDIQARVVIVDGRITSATIAQCMTRWPCSWIEPLPPQVVQRQSPETDFVSGATQSTNAFYYGVVQALGKAALP